MLLSISTTTVSADIVHGTVVNDERSASKGPKPNERKRCYNVFDFHQVAVS